LFYKIAFETLRPFPRRKDISIKQAYYNKILGDSWKKRRSKRESSADQDEDNSALINVNALDNVIECGCIIESNSKLISLI
jgi:hypothetical protein